MIIFTTEEIDELKKTIKRQRNRNGNDKILDNTLNRGEIEYESFKAIKVDDSWYGSQSTERYNSYDEYRNIALNDIIEEIYNGTDWQKYYSNNIKKNIPKQELSEIFSYIKLQILDPTITNVEIFIGIANFLSANYKILYDVISTEFKIQLIQELNKDHKRLKTDNIIKLF